MAEIFVMPQIGRLAKTPILDEWLVDVGDSISVGQEICVVETDKATVECESPFAGVLLRRVEAGDVVPMGEPIAVIGLAGEDVAQFRLFGDDVVEPPGKISDVAEPKGVADRKISEPTDRGRVRSTPVARRLAAEAEIELSEIEGTGPNGEITRADVESVIRSGSAAEFLEPTKIQLATASAMTLSAAIPQFSIERRIDVQLLVDALTDSVESGKTPSVEDALIVAYSRSVRDHPVFLRSWIDGRYRVQETVNVGIATATVAGLIVPVLADVEGLSIHEVAVRRRELQTLAKTGNLGETMFGEAAATTSNLGVLGVHRFNPLLNPPEPCIFGIGAIVRDYDQRSKIFVSMTSDHRVVNGADAASLLTDISARLESASELP